MPLTRGAVAFDGIHILDEHGGICYTGVPDGRLRWMDCPDFQLDQLKSRREGRSDPKPGIRIPGAERVTLFRPDADRDGVNNHADPAVINDFA